ncbi:MAG: RNA polymerase factor sigma-54 [bacterium]
MQGLRQELKLKQELVLQPQQILRAELLQMPLLELEMRVRAELEENPFLEEVAEEAGEEVQSPEDERKELDEVVPAESDKEEETSLPDKSEELDWDDLMNDTSIWEYRSFSSRGSDEELPEPIQPATKTFIDSLLEQLYLDNLSPMERAIGEEIIGNLNRNGYLQEITLEEIAVRIQQNFPQVTLESVEAVHRRILSYDPPGVGARNLQECLLAQLESRAIRHPLAETIVSLYWDDLIHKRYEVLQNRLGVSREEIREAFEVISRLNPKPGEGSYDEKNLYVVPDLIVTRIGEKLEVFLNDSNLPHFRVNTAYYDLIKRQNTDKKVKEFLLKKLESAKWFITALHQRRLTILQTMRAIVEKQKEFFLNGPGNLKPMILRDIADEIGMDISTISRVTNGKYVQTDWGVFELKYFFSESIPTQGGDEVSNRVIKERLKELIINENKNNPYTDQQLTTILKREGFQIERRTVAKYREQLGIPIRRLRRQV